MFEMVFSHVMELLLESQTRHSAALTELAVHGEEVSSLQEAAPVAYRGSASSIPEQTVVQRRQVPFRCGTGSIPVHVLGSGCSGGVLLADAVLLFLLS